MEQQVAETSVKPFGVDDFEAATGVEVPKFGPEEFYAATGIPVPSFENVHDDTSATETATMLGESKIPSFEHLVPEPNAVKTYVSPDGKFDLRLSCSIDHQDGLAYNAESKTVVVCDGLGGIGTRGDVKDFFGFALAHAAAELDDISTLQDPATVMLVVEKAKSILEQDLGIPIEDTGSLVKTSMGGGFKWASTLAAAQQVPSTNRWRIATIGDSSVAVLDKEGFVVDGYGEAFQLLATGNVGISGTVDDGPMNSLLGISKTSLEGGVKYGNDTLGAQFAEIELAEGNRLVLVSDAYIQKSPLSTLEADAKKTSQEWAASKPFYSDDTTMAIIS